MRKKVFISRNLGADSPFKTKLEQHKIEVIGQSLIQFEAVPFESVPDTDWLFFYSKNGVRFFYKNSNAALTKDIRLAALGTGTASVLQKYTSAVDFVGNGEPDATAKAFRQVAKGTKTTFVCARKSRHSVRQKVEQHLETQDLVVYDNRIAPPEQLPDFEVLVFTSPLNVQSYLVNHQVSPTQIVIAIGRTTGTALKKAGITTFEIAKSPDEYGLAEAVEKVCNL